MNKKIAIVAVLLMLLLPAMASVASDAASTITVNGAVVSTFDESRDAAAGSPVNVTVTVLNTSPLPISVSLSAEPGDVQVDIPVKEATIAPNDAAEFALTEKTDKYADNGDYSATVTVKVYSYETETMETGALHFTLHVKSAYINDSEFNKILGVLPPLPAPLDTPLVSAAVTMVIWCIIAAAAVCVVALFVHRFFRNDRADGKGVVKTTGTVLAVMILLYGAGNSFSVYGADPEVMAAVGGIVGIVYVILGAIIVWNLYTSIISALFHGWERKGKLESVDTSLIPLFRMIGKIIVAVCAVAAILWILGFDLIALLTGAGIVAVAVSLGAQTTLERFFAGVMILTTRPFVVGDMIQIEGGTIYEVKRIGLMNCEFKNWENQEYTVMPTTTVSKAKISNVTKKSLAYRIILYFDTDYEVDLELAKKIILEEACRHPAVVQTGEYDMPSARLESMEDSWLTFRLACYIDDFRKNVTVSGEIRENVYLALLDAGIDCPYEVVDVRTDRKP